MTAETLASLLNDDIQRDIAAVRQLGGFRWRRENHPMVLIGQVQRSGGTLLARLLDGHPDLDVYPHELYWSHTDETKWPEVNPDVDATNLFRDLTMRQATHIERFATAGYNKFGRSRDGDPRAYLYSVALHRDLFLQHAGDGRLAAPRDVLDAWLSSFFGAWLDYRDRYIEAKRWWVAFGKRHNLGDTPARFFEDYPDGRLITIVRRPEDWLASATHHQPRSYAEDPGAALDVWRRSAEASLRLATGDPQRVRLIIFEHLVMETDDTLDRILKWLGAAPSGSSVPTFNGASVHSNSAFTPTTGLDESVIGRGTRSLAPGAAWDELDQLYHDAADASAAVR